MSLAHRRARPLFIVLSLTAHFSVFYALETAALRPVAAHRKDVELSLIRPPPAPPPPPEPEKPKTPEVKKLPDPKKAEPPPADEPPPMFGVSLSSTTVAPGGFRVRVGNTTMVEPTSAPTGPVKPLSGRGDAPVSIAQLSKKPERLGDCPPFDPSRLYTQAAKDQQIEGKVELEVTVANDGSVKDVRVRHGVGYGLDEAAVDMMRHHCQFSPAELNGEKVATKINYTVTFALPD